MLAPRRCHRLEKRALEVELRIALPALGEVPPNGIHRLVRELAVQVIPELANDVGTVHGDDLGLGEEHVRPRMQRAWAVPRLARTSRATPATTAVRETGAIGSFRPGRRARTLLHCMPSLRRQPARRQSGIPPASLQSRARAPARDPRG